MGDEISQNDGVGISVKLGRTCLDDRIIIRGPFLNEALTIVVESLRLLESQPHIVHGVRVADSNDELVLRMLDIDLSPNDGFDPLYRCEAPEQGLDLDD